MLLEQQLSRLRNFNGSGSGSTVFYNIHDNYFLEVDVLIISLKFNSNENDTFERFQ